MGVLTGKILKIFREEGCKGVQHSGNNQKIIFWLVFFALAFRLIFFVKRFSVNVLFWDQWDFLWPITNESTTLIKMFTLQHGPHRQGFGGVMQYIIYPLSNWDVRVEVYFSVILVLFSSLIAIELKKRLFGKLKWTDITIPLLYFSLIHYETFIGTPNLAHGTIPLLLVTSAAFILTMKSEWIKITRLTIISFLSVFTGFAIFSGFLIFFLIFSFTIHLKYSKQLLFNLIMLILVVLFFVLFFMNYKLAPAVDCFQFPHTRPFEYFEFSALQFGRAFQISMIPDMPYISIIKRLIVGGIFLILLCSCLYFAWLAFKTKEILYYVIFYLSAFTIIFIVTTAIGRICLGLKAATISRYAIYSTPGVLAIYFGLLHLYKNKKITDWLKKAVLYGFITLMVLKEIATFAEMRAWEWFSHGKKDWVECYLNKGDINKCNDVTNFKIYPEEQEIEQKLKYFEENQLSFFSSQKIILTEDN